MPDEVMGWTQDAYAQTVSVYWDLNFDLATCFLHATHRLVVMIIMAK